MSSKKQSSDEKSSREDTPAAAVSVACLVLHDQADFVLITQRPKGKQLEGLWEFPGGKVETAESAETALRRELREELHLEVGSLRPMKSVTHAYEFGTIRLIPFLAKCERRPAIHLIEHAAARWSAVEELDRFDWAPADLPVVDELKTMMALRAKRPIVAL